jgi:hypothetical protein
MAIGELLLDQQQFPTIPPVAPAVLPPPVLPQDMVAQMQGYRNAFSNMEGDPNFAPAMMRLGLNLMQPVRPGDTPGGVVSRAGTDAMDYYTARTNMERNQLLTGVGLGQRERELQSKVGAQAEATAASAQQRAVTAAQAPVQLGQLKQQYETAKKGLELIEAEEKAGVRSPDFLQRKAVAETAVREALAKMYGAHADFYRSAGQAQGAKSNKQTLNVRPVENQDGTTSLVSTVVVNGEPYFHTFTPPRFADLRAATEHARKEVEKETPSAWNPFAGAAPYQGTPDEEIARRAKLYMTPSLQILGPRGMMTKEQYDALDGPRGGPPPSGAPMPPGFPRESQQQAQQATERSLGVIRGELRDARQAGNAELVASLIKEEENAVKLLKGGHQGHTPAAPVPSQAAGSFERDASGNIVPKGKTPAATPASAAAPAAPATPQPSELAGQALEVARRNLVAARNVLMGFGARQQRADPVGYRNALMAVSQGQEEAARAQQEYEKLMTPGAAARMPVRRP